MKEKLIVFNWKMNPVKEIDALKNLQETIRVLPKKNENTIVVCPPPIFLSPIAKKIKKILLGSQGGFYEESGAFTGENSLKQYAVLGVSYSIVGHSEMRARGVSDEYISLQVSSCLKNKISPIICVGEKERNDDHWHFHVVKDQLEKVLKGLNPTQAKKIVIAYEPVWAIGKNALREATKEECMEMIIFIRRVLSDLFGEKIAHSIKILYGGSVDEKNARMFIENGQSDGLLVGRVSLQPKSIKQLLETLVW